MSFRRHFLYAKVSSFLSVEVEINLALAQFILLPNLTALPVPTLLKPQFVMKLLLVLEHSQIVPFPNGPRGLRVPLIADMNLKLEIVM